MGYGGRSLEIARAEGAHGLWWRGLGATFYRRLTVFARPLEARPPAPPAGIAVGAELLELATIDAYLALRPGTAVEAERRLASGQRCLLIRHHGAPVSARWFADGRAELPYLGLACDLPEGVVYVHDAYTAPAARGLGISAAMRSYHEVLLSDEGCHTRLAAVMPENLAGRALVASEGFQPVGRIGCLRIGPARIPVRRCPAAYLGRAGRLLP